MREFLTVLGYTFTENLRKKTFVVSTIIVLFLTVGIVSVPGIINHFQNKKNGTATEKIKGSVFVVDSKGIIKEDMAALQASFSGYEFRSENADKIDSIKEAVKNNSNVSLMIVDEKNGVPHFDYYGSGLSPDVISRILKASFSGRILKSANVADDVAVKALSDVSFDVKESGKTLMKGYIACYLVMMLLFFSVYFYGYGVSMSVASEKTSRVMELLITSTKPSKIILGKSAAMGLLGLGQLSLILLSAGITYKLSFPDNFMLGGQKLDFSNFTPASITIMIIYFILGYSLYAMMNAVAGATVSKAEDVQSAIMPISMITMVAFYFAYGSVLFPDKKAAMIASIIPFSAPFSMPSRFLMSDVPLWQLISSLAILILSIVLMAWVSIKLYSSAVLHYGKRLKIKDLVRMSKN